MNLKGFFKKFVLVCILLIPAILFAQMRGGITDSNYIRSYDTTFTGRIYLSQKYLALNIKDADTSFILKYRPNSKLAIGIGATYGWLTLNISAGVAYLNPEGKNREKTKAFDLQSHFYGPKFTIDFLGQYYKSFYLAPQGTATSKDNWYVRPDMKMLQLGFSAFYAVNWRKFSYRAAYLQNEWQVKSAGSILLGVDLIYEQAKSDSAFVPAVYKNSFRSAGIRQIQFGDIGPAAGYAYTLVIAKHFFVSAALTGALSLNVVKESREITSETKFALNPNYAFRTGIGYNSRRFTTSLTWVNNSTIAKGDAATYTVYAGNARFHIAWRFPATKKMQQKLKFFEKPLLQ